MGKFVKKGKITGDVAVMEVPQATLGVRTRAKALALQPNPELCYLQLRSRRLEKPQFPPLSPKKSDRQKQFNRSSADNNSLVHGSNSRFRVGPLNSGPAQPASLSPSKKGKVDEDEGRFSTEVVDFSIEASFGENKFDFDQSGRSTRESTPCSLIRDLDSKGTPGSAVRSTCSYQRQSRNSVQRAIPSTQEMEDFFASAEMKQHKHFMDKYNFDVVNDLPLPGRYEWVRIDP